MSLPGLRSVGTSVSINSMYCPSIETGGEPPGRRFLVRSEGDDFSDLKFQIDKQNKYTPEHAAKTFISKISLHPSNLR